eukprot:1161057-Pelagomonas_calceolata.AAC.8
MDSKWQGSFFYVPFPVHCVPHLLRQKWQVVKDLLLKARPAEPFLNKAYVDKLCALPCTSRMFEIDLKAVVYSTHLHTYTSLTCLMSVYAVEHSRCLFMQVSKPAAMLFMCQIMHCTFVRVQIFRLSLYDETKIANALNQVHKENSSSGVNVGSYPVRTYRSRMYRSQSYYVLSNKCLQQATVCVKAAGIGRSLWVADDFVRGARCLAYWLLSKNEGREFAFPIRTTLLCVASISMFEHFSLCTSQRNTIVQPDLFEAGQAWAFENARGGYLRPEFAYFLHKKKIITKEVVMVQVWCQLREISGTGVSTDGVRRKPSGWGASPPVPQ